MLHHPHFDADPDHYRWAAEDVLPHQDRTAEYHNWAEEGAAYLAACNRLERYTRLFAIAVGTLALCLIIAPAIVAICTRNPA